METLDPAFVFEGDVAQSLLVVGDGADGADRAAHGTAFHQRGFQVHPLRRRGVDLDFVFGGRVRAFVNGHHVHAHRILARPGLNFAGDHR